MPTGGVSSTGGRASAGQSSTGGQGGVAGGRAEYPLELLGCGGTNHENDSGYDGQCCYEALCYESAECLPADSGELRPLLLGFPPGSGSCLCSFGERDAVSGPFAPNRDDPELPGGSCCYLVGGIACEGRPLLIQGVPRIAPVIARKDWGLAA